MIGHPHCFFSGRRRLALAVLVLTSLAVLAGAMKSSALPRLRGSVGLRASNRVVPHAATSTIVHSFDPTTEGNAPEYGLVQGSDGTLYGVTTQTAGSATSSNSGIVFKVNPDGTHFTILHSLGNGTDGAQPGAKLLLVGNLLFGTCQSGGGDNYGGTLFVINLSQVSSTDNTAGFAVLHYFGNTFGTNVLGGTTIVPVPATADGITPRGSLCLGADGNIYGTTSVDGAGGRGTIFRLSPNSSGQFSTTPSPPNSGSAIPSYQGTYTTIYNFSGSTTDGANPRGGVIQLSDGFLYGTTLQGGNPTSTGGSPLQNTTSFGTVYKFDLTKIDPAGDSGFTLLHAFTGGLVIVNNAVTGAGDGEAPECDLIQATDGNLYGTTYAGGPGNVGTVFQIKPDSYGVFSANSPYGTIAALSNNTGNQLPGGVIQASDGNLYGATLTNGPGGSGNGSVFQIKPNPSSGKFDAVPDPLSYGVSTPDPYTDIYTFFGGAQPGDPDGPVIQGLDGQLYGESLFGGSGSAGTVFAVNAGLPAPPFVTGVSGTINPPNVTNGDTTLVVHGRNFGGGDTVAIDGRTLPGTPSYDFSQADEKITVTLSVALPAGPHTVTVATPNGKAVSNAFQFLVTSLLPPILVTSVSGTISPPSVTSADTTLTVHGTGFGGGYTVAIDGVTVPGPYALNFHVSTDEQITVTLAGPLAGGTHSVVVSYSGTGGSASSPFSFTVTLLSPQIIQVTNGHGGAVTTADTTLIVNGNSFAAGDSVFVSLIYAGTTLSKSASSNGSNGTQITVNLSQPLPVGDHSIIVTHGPPDNRASNTYTLTVQAVVPAITSVTGVGSAAPTTNDTTLTIHGTNFASSDIVGITTIPASESVATGSIDLSNPADEKITVTLSAPLPPETFLATVTGSAAFPFTVTAAPAPTITSTAYKVAGGQGVLTINGTGFVHGTTLTVTPNNPNVTLGGTLTAAYVSSTQLTGTFSQPLPPGVYTVTVTNPDNQSATGTAYVLAVTGVNYSLSTLKVTLSGAGFAPGAKVSVSSDASSAAIPTQGLTVSPDGSTITFTLAHALSAGHITFVVTNPDGQTGSTDLYLPAISSVRYTVTSGGYQLLIAGAGFDPTSASVTVDGTALTVTQRTEQQITATGSPALTPGRHTVTVTNGDGAGTSFTITVSAPPAISANGGTFLTNSSGSTLLVITGTNFVTSVNSAVYPNFVAGATVDGTFEAATVVDTGTNSNGEVISQLFIPVGTKFGEGPHSIVVRNPDGTGSDGSVVTPQARVGGKAVTTRAVSPHASATTAQIYNSDHTSYVASASPQNTNPILQGILNFLSGVAGLFGFNLSGGGAPTRVALGQVGAVSNTPPPVAVTTHGGATVTGLIGEDGSSVISNDGGSLIGEDGSSLIGEDGSSLISQDGMGLVSNSSGTLVSNASGTLVGPSGGTLTGPTVANLIGNVDNTSGANSLNFQKASATGAARPRAVAPLAGSAPASFAFQKSDQSGHGTGPSDFTVTGTDGSGNTLTLLQMRFTPGQRDQVLYVIPGLVLTPTGNTPAPTAGAGVVQVTPGAFRSEHGHEGQLSQLLTLTNPTSFAVTGRLGVTLSGLPSGVTVLGATGGVVPASATGMAGGATMQMRVYFAAPSRPVFADTAQAVLMP